MSSDDDDYMSAAFTNVTEDIRPGLVKSSITKRKYDIEKKAVECNKRHKTKPVRQLEEENRNVGLNSAITPDNKGFAMLQKMGYKPGMKLGAQKDKAAGLQEPIKIQVREGRGGLGREEVIKQKIKEIEKKRAMIKVYKERETERLTEDFRKRMRDKVMYKKNKSDLYKLRSVCERLDSENDIKEPMRSWFWCSTQEDYDDDDDYEEENEEPEDEQLEMEEQLYFINDYLRSKYFYCVWCGVKYNDDEDIRSNCPGPDKDDHDE